ncbi:MAG: aldehyde dehydrogenase family protein [Nocardioides marinisabuli]|uniref:aldehyde dehydrogenase family protein n=1 Tax=Nocardioides marinisabuli TaxID=419476 RepID=UPI0032191A59
MQPPTQPIWVAGQQVTGTDTTTITPPDGGDPIARVTVASAEHAEGAVHAADAISHELASLPAHRRADALDHVSRRLVESSEELAQLVMAEGGKPIRWARVEVSRAAATFRLASEEARRWSGELQRLDTDPAGEGRIALNRRVPRGPVLGITPFNFPLNLVAHKVAPALAVGAPIVLKPAPATPLSALFIGDLLAETDLPAGSWSVITTPNAQMDSLVTDPRLPVVSFTGSGPVGWSICDRVPRKHVTLELGGNAAAVVCADWNSDADLKNAAQRIAAFGMGQAGQSCISVQRVIADTTIYQRLLDLVLIEVDKQVLGDPADEATTLGPMINTAAAERAHTWVDEAVQSGAHVLTGGNRHNARLEPTVIVDAPLDARVNRDEVFAPVISVRRVDNTDEAFAAVNDSQFGLQVGIFTHDIGTAFRAHRDLDVGGIIIGDVPSYRADQMPYGGTKGSGIGREGIRYAMDDLTYDRSLVFTGAEL